MDYEGFEIVIQFFSSGAYVLGAMRMISEQNEKVCQNFSFCSDTNLGSIFLSDGTFFFSMILSWIIPKKNFLKTIAKKSKKI